MRFEITSPCDEDWDGMQPVDGGRYCLSCEKVVIDLASMSRAQAKQKIEGLDASEVCVQLAVDRFGDAVFQKPPPSRAPHWAAGLVLVSALGASACGTSEPPPCEVEVVAEAPQTVSALDPGPPMMPAIATLEPALPTRAVPASELNDPDADSRPSAAQRALTAAKHEPVRPPIQHLRGRMPIRGMGF